MKLLENIMMSSFKTSQHFWKKAIENPSRPGALSPFSSLTTSNTSLSSKALYNQALSSTSMEWSKRPSNFGHQLRANLGNA
jgi:hypothetical protein